MGKQIEKLRWKPMWTSHIGCLKGCLEHLGINVSDAWLFGATGHAFVINIHEVVCPSGPTAWKSDILHKLGRNAGFETETIIGVRIWDNFEEKQRLARDRIRRAIDEGLPCYGWELDIPEYYVIHGYDDEGYYFSGPLCDSGKWPKPWKEVGSSQIGVLEMHIVKRGHAADNAKIVKEALEFALEHSRNSEKWTFPEYKSGLTGYDLWIEALESGRAHPMGMAYNAAVWHECRRFAVEFLKEAKERLPGDLGPLFDEAIGPYQTVAENLNKVCELFPFPPKGDELQDEKHCKAGLQLLHAAREAEEAGLHALQRIATEL